MSSKERSPNLERVEFELRSTGIRKEQFNPLRSGTHTRGYLPHVKREGAPYFVTFRLADSLPKEVFLKILQIRAHRLARLSLEKQSTNRGAPASASEAARQVERDYFLQMEDYLDKGYGKRWLCRPAVAQLVSGALAFFHTKRYHLRAWVVMPTHVHVVVWPMPNHTLSSILHSWKGFTGKEANKILGHLGQPFWQPESYDHWIRDEFEHDRCCRYVINNPVKARLCKTAAEWRWSSAWSGAT